jgi:hypothetical protein
MRVSRFALAILLGVTSLGASAIWSAAATAEETSKPEDSRAGAGADIKSAPGRAPKDIPIVNPCKAAHPPSYCNGKS